MELQYPLSAQSNHMYLSTKPERQSSFQTPSLLLHVQLRFRYRTPTMPRSSPLHRPSPDFTGIRHLWQLARPTSLRISSARSSQCPQYRRLPLVIFPPSLAQLPTLASANRRSPVRALPRRISLEESLLDLVADLLSWVCPSNKSRKRRADSMSPTCSVNSG